MYDSKMLEVVFPNTLISDNIAKELMEFKKEILRDYGINMVFCVTN